jgi:Putative zinc-finger
MTSPAQHVDVGAYAIGALDPAEAVRFEEHLAWCEQCAVELEQLMGVGPLLAEYAQSAPDVVSLTARPSRELLDGMLARVAATHRRSRRRRLYLVAAAAALIVAAPMATSMVVSEKAPSPVPVASTFQSMFDDGEGRKADHTDPDTGVRATVSMKEADWGSELTVKLGNVPGPEECDLVAVGKDGSRQTATTWSVPEGGYEWADARYYGGGVGFDLDEIDHFEVETLEGDRLVTVPMA